MRPKCRKFRVELGINLHAAPIPQTNPNMRIFPLQNALVDVTNGDDCARPAWYAHLGIGDEISFRVVDISNLRLPERETDYPDLVLTEFYFNNPQTGQAANPFTEQVVRWDFSKRLDDTVSPPYSLKSTDTLPTWDLIGLDAEGKPIEPLRFADFQESQENGSFRAFELTVAIKLFRYGWVNQYVFDPEMIVSETDNEGDGSGRNG